MDILVFNVQLAENVELHSHAESLDYLSNLKFKVIPYTKLSDIAAIKEQVLSINEIAALMSMMTARHSPEEAYDSFCSALENALVKAFAAEKREVPPISWNEPALVAQSAALAALMGKLMVENCLAQAADAKEAAPDKPQAQKKPPAKTQPKNADMAKAEKGVSAPGSAEEQAQ